ncbi:MAG TPA: hypothetical protein DHV31_01385 [Clostridiales bacterium]|nr:hypothetical protein [Clostridiales bacterium]
MLIDFKVKNFRSINSEVELSMVAENDDSLSGNLINNDGYKLLKTASIYGANGSGKTTVIMALGFMQLMVINSLNHQIGDLINVIPHKLSLDQPTSFEIQYIYHKQRFAYGFTLTKERIIEEYLYYFPVGGRQNKIFERKEDSVSIATAFVSPLKTSKAILQKNKLFLSCGANFANTSHPLTKIVMDAYMFFKEGLVVHNPLAPSPWRNYSISTLQNDKSVKELFKKIMRGLGSDLLDLTAKIEKKKFSANSLPKNTPANLANFIVSLGETAVPTAIIDYGQFSISLDEESNGIRKLFDIICPIINILRTGKVLVYDEIETSLHESIAKELIKLFLANSFNAQLVFTTHDTNLLDLSLLRRDQIWFTELSPEDRSTQLYSLSDINNVRKDENIAKGYIKGKYGAIPMLNASLISELED